MVINSTPRTYYTMRKFPKLWFGPYEVWKVTNKASYNLKELNGTKIQTQIQGKRIKMFKRHHTLFYRVEEEDLFEDYDKVV